MTTQHVLAKLRVGHTNHLVSHLSRDGVSRYVSPGCERLLGFGSDQLVGRSVFDFVHPDDRSVLQQAHLIVQNHPVTISASYRVRTRQGEYVWIETSAHAIRDPETGDVDEIIAFSGPSSSRDRAEFVPIEIVPHGDAMLARVTDAFIAVDREWRITYANDGATRATELPHEQVMGKSIWDVFPGAAGTVFEANFRESLDTQEPNAFEAYYPPLGVWVEARTFPGPDGLSILIQDITDRWHRESALKESEQFLQSALDALSAHIAVLDENGTIIAVNAAWRDYGASNELVSPYDTIGTNYLNVCDAASPPSDEGAYEIAEGIRAVMAGERESYTLEYPCHSPDELRWFMAIVTRFPNADPVRIVVAHEDITARRLAELDRAAAEARYRTLFDQISDTVLIADENARYLDANPAATRMLGYSVEELRQLGVADVVAYSRAWTEQEYERFKRDGAWRGEVELRTKDGRRVPAEVLGTILYAIPEPMYVSVVRDISERKAAEREQQEFISMIAHDLRTPLTSIKGFAQLMQRRQAYEESAVQRISAQVDQLQQMILDLSEVSNVRAGSIDLHLVPTDIVALARSAVESAQATTEHHELVLDTTVEGITGTCDPIRVTRVLQNLLSNAIKYSPDGGEIHVRLEERSGEIVVSVVDRGIGIRPEYVRRLFDPFYRGETGTSKPAGIGLGLAISRAFVEAHDGRIWVESTLGQGSTFSFTLPRKRESAA